MYILKTAGKTLSLHTTQLGALQALSRYNMSDKTGVTAYIVKMSSEVYYAIAAVLVFASIGGMLAL